MPSGVEHRWPPCDLDRTGRIWLYRPAEHKTAYQGFERTIYIGPRGQRVLEPFLLRLPQTFCFSPAESETERRSAAHEARTTPLNCGNRPGTNRTNNPERVAGERAATELRKEFGLDAARIILGQVYRYKRTADQQ